MDKLNFWVSYVAQVFKYQVLYWYVIDSKIRVDHNLSQSIPR